MSARDSLLEARLQEARELNEYAEYTRDVLIPELERLSVPWRYLAWRRLSKEIRRRNDHVRRRLSESEARQRVDAVWDRTAE